MPHYQPRDIKELDNEKWSISLRVENKKDKNCDKLVNSFRYLEIVIYIIIRNEHMIYTLIFSWSNLLAASFQLITFHIALK